MRVNQTLEYMLRACALQYGRSWDKSLPHADFSYNNTYQERIVDDTVRDAIWMLVPNLVVLE
jgi:hypothetical protein